MLYHLSCYLEQNLTGRLPANHRLEVPVVIITRGERFMGLNMPTGRGLHLLPDGKSLSMVWSEVQNL